MEIKEGKLLIKIKGGKHWKKRHVKIDNKDVSISKEFQLDSSMNNKNCLVYLDGNNKIIDIEIDGKKIDKVAKKIVKKFVRCENKNNLRVPNDTCLAIGNNYIDNFNLKLNKFTLFNDKDEAKIKEQNISESFFNANWNFYRAKIINYYKDIQKLNLNFSKPIEFKTNYRLVIGSEQSIYKTSIRLHHIYGIPFIPSTAIKGVVRSYIISEKFENSEDNALLNDDFKKVFGSQEQEGKVIFFDAFPITQPTIKMDIINPIEEEKIINFLTIEDTTFQFLIATKIKEITFKEKRFLVWFKEVLQNHGIGAKTAVGYGYFNEENKP